MRERRNLAILVLLPLLLLSACTPAPVPRPTRAASAAVFSVDCSAADAGTGSRAHPWNTLDAVDRHGAFRPGERILLRRGTTCRGRLAPQGSGTNAAPIVLGAYGTGARPRIDGGATADRTGAVQLSDQHDWIVQDLEVTNFDPDGPDSTLRAGILVVNDAAGALADITIRRNVVRRVTSSPGPGTSDPHEYGGIAVLVRGTGRTAATFSNVRIEGNLVDHVGRTGIVTWSDGGLTTPMTDVSINRNRLIDTDGDSILLWGVEGGVVDHDTSTGGGHLPACPRCTSPVVATANAGIWPVMSKDVVIRYSEVSGYGAAGGDGEGFDVDESASDVVVEGNYAHENDGGGVLICGGADTDIRYNVFEHDGGGEIVFNCPTARAGIRIVNNTIHLGPDDTAQVVQNAGSTGTDQILFANNVVDVRNGGGYAFPSPVLASHDIFSGNHPASQPADAAGLPDDPLLVQGGAGGTGIDSAAVDALTAGSPAAASGLAVADSGTTDYLGHSVDPAHPDRGAFARAGIPARLDPISAFRAVRADGGVRLTWTAGRGTVQRIERAGPGGRWIAVSGLLTRGTFEDAGAPAGRLRYRLIAVGRDTESVRATATASAAGVSPSATP